MRTLFAVFFVVLSMLNVDSFVPTPTPLMRSTAAHTRASFARLLSRHSRPGSYGQPRLRMSDSERELPAGSVDQQREEMNRQMMEREAAYEGMKRRIRAESYEYGEADFRGLFARFDSDKNGALDRVEFENLCERMGMRVEALTEEERQIILSEASNGSDGMVGVREFLRWISNNSPLSRSTTTGTQSQADRSSKGDPARVWSYGESFLQGQTATEQTAPTPRMPLEEVEGQGDKRADAKLNGRAALVRGWVEDGVADDQLNSVVHFLLYELGVAEHSLVGMAAKAPGVFGMSVDDDLRANVDFLLELGLSKTKVCKLCVTFPHVLQSGLEKKEETALYLEQLGVPRESMGKILSANPQLMGLHIESNLQPTVEFLVQEAGVPLAKLGAVIAAFPNVLSYSIDLNLRPKLRFLREEVGVDQSRIGAILTKFPQILGLSVSGNLRPTVQYMEEELGLAGAEVGKIVQQHPQLLGLSVEANLKLKVKYLVEELGLPAQRLASVISAFPTLLSLSVASNLRPKVQFLLEEAGYDLEDIARSPNLLAYSLERRMRPRFAQLQRMGTRIALGSLLSYSDKEFEKRFGQGT